jgi:hypothetical protein
VFCQSAEEIYVDVARACTENNLLKFSAKGYLMQAGICALCYASDDDMAIKLEQYRSAQGCRRGLLVGSCCVTGTPCKPYNTALSALCLEDIAL